MGFWSSNPNVSYWSYIKSVFTTNTAPYLLKNTTNNINKEDLKNTPGVIYKRAISQNAKEYSKFIETYFNYVKNETQTVIPPEIIEEGLRSNRWYGIEARDEILNIIGIVFSLQVQYLYSSEYSKQPLIECGLVDYFCVSPKWRSKGVGSNLLTKLFELTSQNNRKPHIFASEGSALFHKIPPFIKDNYIWREKGEQSHNNFGELKIYKNKQINMGEIWSSIKADKIFIAYSLANNIIQVQYHDKDSSVHIVLRPTYELKNGKKVGEIIAYWGYGIDSYKIYDYLLDNISDFDIFLATSSFPKRCKWNDGSVFAYYSFHFHPGTFDATRLMLLI